MRVKLDQELDELSELLILMAQSSCSAVEEAFDSLQARNPEQAKQVAELEVHINRMERRIEKMSLKLLLMEQPVASDLRRVSTALKMITDLERIADQAANIAEIALYWMRESTASLVPGSLQEMAEAALEMTRSAIQAFLREDEALARQVIAQDDVVDSFFLQVRNELAAQMRQGIGEANRVLDELMVAKYLERIGDHAQNIAEWVIYFLTGEIEHYN